MRSRSRAASALISAGVRTVRFWSRSPSLSALQHKTAVYEPCLCFVFHSVCVFWLCSRKQLCVNVCNTSQTPPKQELNLLSLEVFHRMTTNPIAMFHSISIYWILQLVFSPHEV
jgi:hypothetical protein